MGDVIEGTGGARKIRIQLAGRGKRGGGRVIYLDVIEYEHLYLLFAYPKNIQEDLSLEQKKIIRKTIELIRRGGVNILDANLCFNSSLSIDEIEENFKDVDFFTGIMEGLQEALAYKEGKASTSTMVRKRSLPSICVVEIRNSLSMTQKEFVEILGVSCRTVESWECGKSTPTPTAKKINVFDSRRP